MLPRLLLQLLQGGKGPKKVAPKHVTASVASALKCIVNVFLPRDFVFRDVPALVARTLKKMHIKSVGPEREF